MYTIGGYLYHHGILGQKWGKRNGPPYPLSKGAHSQAEKKAMKNAGKTLGKTGQSNSSTKVDINKTKKYLTRDTDARKKMKENSEKKKKEIEALSNERPKNNEWWVEVSPYKYRMTEKAKKYYDKVKKIEDKYDKYEDKLQDKHKQEIDQLIKDVYFNDEVKDMVTSARKTYKEIDSVRDKTIGENSKYAKEGYKQYLKDHPDVGDAEYGFYHYEWWSGSDNQYYKKAEAEYKKKSKELQSKYEKQITDIGKKICGELADTKIDKYYTYIDIGKYETEQLVQFQDKYFDDKKK